MTKRKTVTISVTAEHIDNGMSSEDGRYPITLALEQVVSPQWMVYISKSRARLTFRASGEHRYVKLPEQVLRFMHEFDYSCRDEPFSFPLSMPVSALKESA